MKKILLLFFCIFAQLVAKAQSTYYDFTAINDDGETLYYKITDEANREVTLAQNESYDAYSNLTKLVIPAKVKNTKDHNKEYTVVSIGFTFNAQKFDLLKELILPNTLKRFEWQPFLYLKSIKKLTIPASVTHYGGLVFQGLNSLEELEFLSPTPGILEFYYTVFNQDLSKLSIYVPTDCSAAYMSDPAWKKDMNGNTIPYLERITIGTNGYTSLYLENENFEVPAGCTAYIIKGSQRGTETYPKAVVEVFGPGKILPKKTAFILENANKKGKTITYRANVSGIEVDVTGNLLVGSATETEFSGAGYKYYIFSNGSLGQGFYHQGTRKGESIKVKAHRAGLRLPTSFSAPAKPFFFDFEAAKKDYTTGIRETHNSQPAGDNTNIIYDLQGRRVDHPTRGIYIMNGKKFIKK
jgi:hypothetical protein